MPVAFSGGPYNSVNFLGISAAYIVESFADALSSCRWKLIQKIAASADGVVTTAPSNGVTVTVGAITYTMKVTPTGSHDVQIVAADGPATATNLVTKINSTNTTVSASFDGTTVTLSYYNGGSVGNGTTASGWLTWVGGSTTGKLYNGGYKFRTGYLAATPTIAYVYDAGDLGGQCRIRLMDDNQVVQGVDHLIPAGVGVSLRMITSPVQFFLFSTTSDTVSICGGSFHTLETVSSAWYAFGNRGITDFLNGFQNPNLTDSECSYDGTYVGPTFEGAGVTRVTYYSYQMQEFRSGVPAPFLRYGGDPWVSEPFLLSGDSPTSSQARLRGQLFDSLIVGKAFVSGYTGTQLAQAYPWSDGSTTSSGFPRNRLSADFDVLTQWENVTDNYSYGALFVGSFGAGSGTKLGNYSY